MMPSAQRIETRAADTAGFPAHLADVLLVYKRSTIDFYECSDDPAVRRFLASDDPLIRGTVACYRRNKEENERSIIIVERTLQDLGIRYEKAWRATIADGNGKDLIIAVGGDGTVLEAARHAHGTPLLGVNSDTGKSVGFYDWTTADGLREVLLTLPAQPRTTLQRLELVLDGVRLPEIALNDVHIKNDRSAMCRTIIENDGYARVCAHDGLLVCAPGGASAYMRNAGGMPMALDEKRMQYRSLNRKDGEHGLAERLAVTAMARTMRIFIDGEHVSYPFPIGSTLALTLGRPVTIIGDLEQRRASLMG
jgi:hypothetical protein